MASAKSANVYAALSVLNNTSELRMRETTESVLERSYCKILALNNFKEILKEQGFIPNWMLSESRGNSMTGSYLTPVVIYRCESWTIKKAVC